MKKTAEDVKKHQQRVELEIKEYQKQIEVEINVLLYDIKLLHRRIRELEKEKQRCQ